MTLFLVVQKRVQSTHRPHHCVHRLRSASFRWCSEHERDAGKMVGGSVSQEGLPSGTAADVDWHRFRKGLRFVKIISFFFVWIANVTLFLWCARAAQGARTLLPIWSTHHSARSNSVLRRGWRDDWLQADIPGKPQPLVEVRVNTRCYPSLSSAIAVEFSGCRLLLGSCGTAQYRLQGPGKWSRAAEVVRNVPVTPLMMAAPFITLVILYYLTYFLFYVITSLFF